MTEMITGIDLVREQILVAEGAKLSFEQEDLRVNGWAIEARIYAEDAENNFLPSTGTLDGYREPSGPGVRVDAGVEAGSEVSVYYDPLLAKLVAHGQDRIQAIERMLRASREYRIFGVSSTVGLASAVIDSAAFRAGNLSTSFLEDHFPEGFTQQQDAESLVCQSPLP